MLQRHYASIEAMALDRDTVEEVIDFTRMLFLLLLLRVYENVNGVENKTIKWSHVYTSFLCFCCSDIIIAIQFFVRRSVTL